MLAHESKDTSPLRRALDELARLRRFAGPPAEFWPAFMAAAGDLTGACRGMLILRDPKQPDRLKKLSDWSSNGHADRAAKKVVKIIEKKVAPAPVVRQMLKIIQDEAKVEVDSLQATQVVKGTLKKAVKKATTKIVEEALAG